MGSWFSGWFSAEDYWLARLLFQRALAVIYLVAFLSAANQFRGLLGERGLTPVSHFVREVPFRRSPSIFHLHYSDRFFATIAWTGVVLSAAIAAGLVDDVPLWASMLIWATLWVLYLSIVNVGQTWYAFGWESLLLEAGFLAVFLGSATTAPPILVLLLLRWLLFRLEFGAGLIKLRGDACWRDLTCLYYHHETQPMPGPLSWYFHHLPRAAHKVEVASEPPRPTGASRRQLMNYTFNPIHLVNTYGAFGSIERDRYEVVLEGTAEPELTPTTSWREYEFKGKPGDARRRPPQVAPYHLRLDWLMWFAAISPGYAGSWFLPLVISLLTGEQAVLRLLRTNPFPDSPPTFVRARLYLYRYTSWNERRKTKAWWKRTPVGEYLPPVALRGGPFLAGPARPDGLPSGT